jgi:hypothetical protein
MQQLKNCCATVCLTMATLCVLSCSGMESSYGTEADESLPVLPELVLSPNNVPEAGHVILSRFSDAEAARFPKRMHLSSVYIWGGDTLTDVGLQSLCACISPSDLGCWSLGGVSDAGLRHIAEVQTIRWLSIANCKQLSPDGLLVLSKLRNLDYLELDGFGEDVSDIVARLRDSHPKATIVVRDVVR